MYDAKEREGLNVDDIRAILWIVTLISAIFGRVTIVPSSKSRERSSSSNLALGTLCNILPTREFSPDYRQRRPPPPVRRRHRLIRLGSTLSALEQALKSKVEPLQREPARYRPNFRSARRRDDGVLPVIPHEHWLNIIEGRDTVVVPSRPAL